MPDDKKDRCPKCGGAHRELGTISALGMRFNPRRARRFYAVPVGIAARACIDCGYLEPFVSTKQLQAAMRQDALPKDVVGPDETPPETMEDIRARLAALESENRRLKEESSGA